MQKKYTNIYFEYVKYWTICGRNLSLEAIDHCIYVFVCMYVCICLYGSLYLWMYVCVWVCVCGGGMCVGGGMCRYTKVFSALCTGLIIINNWSNPPPPYHSVAVLRCTTCVTIPAVQEGMVLGILGVKHSWKLHCVTHHQSGHASYLNWTQTKTICCYFRYTNNLKAIQNIINTPIEINSVLVSRQIIPIIPHSVIFILALNSFY